MGCEPPHRPRPHPTAVEQGVHLDETGEAARAVHRNEIEGKAGVLCLAPSEGLGIDDPEKRDRIGEHKIDLQASRRLTSQANCSYVAYRN